MRDRCNLSALEYTVTPWTHRTAHRGSSIYMYSRSKGNRMSRATSAKGDLKNATGKLSTAIRMQGWHSLPLAASRDVLIRALAEVCACAWCVRVRAAARARVNTRPHVPACCCLPPCLCRCPRNSLYARTPHARTCTHALSRPCHRETWCRRWASCTRCWRRRTSPTFCATEA